MNEIQFGCFIPQGWKMELAGIIGAEAKWAKTVEVAVLAEELGFDSIWVYDHVHNVPRPAHEAVFECWTTIAAISQLTSRIRLGLAVVRRDLEFSFRRAGGWIWPTSPIRSSSTRR